MLLIGILMLNLAGNVATAALEADWRQQSGLWKVISALNTQHTDDADLAVEDAQGDETLLPPAWLLPGPVLAGGFGSGGSADVLHGGAHSAHARQCRHSLGGLGVSVIMVADPGDFSGSPERMHYVANLRDAREIPAEATMCASKTLGTLMGQQVVVVASGIGPVAAAVCTIELLSCGKYISEIIYVGTSGWSPQLGGILSVVPYGPRAVPPAAAARASEQAPRSEPRQARQMLQAASSGSAEACSNANPLRTPNRVGDVCISPLAANWVCKKADYLQQCADASTLCTLPGEVSGPAKAALYGRCEFTAHSAGQRALAEELVAAARGVAARMPLRNAATQAWESSYWSAMANGTGVDYVYDAAAPPLVHDAGSCLEVDSQFFYTGPPYEMAARLYAAETINAALNTTLDMTQVIAVSAMEAVGLDAAVELYNGLAGVRPLPYVNVRGMSNQLHKPVQRDADGRWVYSADIQEDYVNGYKYAIATTSTGVLQAFSLRCQARAGKDAALCQYRVEYP